MWDNDDSFKPRTLLLYWVPTSRLESTRVVRGVDLEGLAAAYRNRGLRIDLRTGAQSLGRFGTISERYSTLFRESFPPVACPRVAPHVP